VLVIFDVYCYLQTAQVVGSSPRCTMSEPSSVESCPVQHSRSSVSNDAGPLLNGLPPHTLSSYPVYRAIRIRVGIKADNRPRPLSYRWLIRHCAEHIYVKPSIVERYVERLELLHIVPRNLHDSSEEVMRSALLRRCFKRDDTPRRRRRRPVTSFPPRKLL